MVERGRARVAQRQQRDRRRDAGGAREVECSHRRAAAELDVADEEDVRPAAAAAAAAATAASAPAVDQRSRSTSLQEAWARGGGVTPQQTTSPTRS